METIYESSTYTDSFQHIGNCAESGKTIQQTITIDDGTGKLYDYVLTKDIEWKEYTIQPDFNVNPTEPTIIDNTEIIPTINDPYDIVQEDGVDYDFSEDGTSLNHQEDETVRQVLSVPRLQTVIQTVRYFTGWEIKTNSISKNIEKTNIPPEACNEENISCFTVPTAIYTSCSTDQEDNPQNLRIDWELYLDLNSYIEISEDENGNEVRTVVYDEDNQDWSLQTSLDNNTVFSWTYNNEGRYKLIEIATDTDGDSSNAVRKYNIAFQKCDDTVAEDQTIQAYGEIEVEGNTWQLCAIPMVNGYWDKDKHKIINNKNNPVRSTIKNVIIDQVEDVYGTNATEYIKVINTTAVGDLEGTMYNYIPGVTKGTSVHNFNLVQIDDDNDLADDLIKYEICGFWIKPNGRDFKIKWGVIE